MNIIYMIRPLAFVILILIFHHYSSFAQNTDTSKTITVIPGKEFQRSGWHNLFWGKHYRREWSTPVTVNKFYIDTALGGLTPAKEGGGRQTKTLRLKDAKDKE